MICGNFKLAALQNNTAGEKKGNLSAVKDHIDLIAWKGYVFFGAGGALGLDTLTAQCVLSLKIITQTKDWSQSEMVTYGEIKNQADKVVRIFHECFRGRKLMKTAVWQITSAR